jgi:hypothetical protein
MNRVHLDQSQRFTIENSRKIMTHKHDEATNVHRSDSGARDGYANGIR